MNMWRWTGKTPIDYAQFNKKAADSFLGKSVIIGKTYQKPDGTVKERKQWYGTIVQVHQTDGFAIKLKDSEEIMWLPPQAQAMQKAPPGIYKLKSTGDEIEDPDFISNWIVDV